MGGDGGGKVAIENSLSPPLKDSGFNDLGDKGDIFKEVKKFVDSILSGELSGKSVPKQDFMDKINFDMKLFGKLLHDGIIGDAGAEVWIV